MLVGLSGKKRAGKDTVAEHLVQQWGFVRVAFADPLRELALKLDPIVGAEVDELGGRSYRIDGRVEVVPVADTVHLSDVVRAHGWEVAKDHVLYGAAVRGVLQRLGVGVRELFTDAWLNAARAEIVELLDSGRRVVVSDVRFPNEAAFIQSGGALVRVERPCAPSRDQHVSETALDDHDFDVTLWNVGTLQGLRDQVDHFASAALSR